MFTGIIETIGEVIGVVKEKGNIHFDIRSSISSELHIDQSVAHDGTCLTVVQLGDNLHRVTAIEETLEKTNLKSWAPGRTVNLERCMPANGRFDGHIVQGHVDSTGICLAREESNGSWRFRFQYPDSFQNLLVPKGSITINGVSLTVVDTPENTFTVAIIPYTFENTGFLQLQEGQEVNLEFDVVGKYVARMLEGRLSV